MCTEKEGRGRDFKAMKMKIGLGPKEDLKLVQAVREAIGKDFKLMVDANHAYNVNDALYVGRGLDELDIFWFEEPVAPENYDGYRELKQKINTAVLLSFYKNEAKANGKSVAIVIYRGVVFILALPLLQLLPKKFLGLLLRLWLHLP